MRASPRVFLFAIPVLAVLGALSLLPRREPSRATSARAVPSAQTEPPLVAEVPSPTSTPTHAQPAPALSAPQVAASAAPPLDESSLASEMHALEDSNPARALELARHGQASWPDGPRAAEFAATEVKCLYRLGDPSAGRGAAEAMVNKYVGSPWAIEVERQTGAHAYVNH